ncbi:hypothetical protein [Actinacidiphila glaucinigra]|uniref:baeRF2 domain-containing protein n=1 Tax=Actinacidiphila glaucinigra TaxID=235986 RepID=UPI002E32EA93|nr:hypothetical protein [Actinacidiphila glaucinigra]
MRLAFLEHLYAHPGPYASVYLDTSRDVGADPDAAIALRWRHLRDELTSQGADPPCLTSLARAVGSDSDLPGPHGQAIFTAHGTLALKDELPRPPARDTAGFGTLPDTMPLATQHAPDIPYVAAVVRYSGPHTTGTDRIVTVEAEAGTWPLAKVTPSARLHERIPVHEWPQSAMWIGRTLDGWARRIDADALVLAGDVWARGILQRRLPTFVRGRTVTVEGRHTPEPGRALLEIQLEHLFAGRMSAHDRMLMSMFLAQRAHDGAAAEGLTPAVTALQRGQVKAMLLNDHPESALRLWVGPRPTQLALTEEELRHCGVDNPRQERAGVALLRALVGTAAELVVVPQQRLRLREGVGVLLRYADRGAATRD